MLVNFFKKTSPKAVTILFQALTALIENFPYKFVQNEGLNSLPVEETSV